MESSINIRRARAGDLPAILRIEKSSFARDAWNREQFLDYLAQPAQSIFLVAVIDGKTVGYALAWRGTVRAEIDSIAIAPSWRGLGVATALLNRVTRVLRRRGIASISLCVRLDNHAAIQLYRKLGFRRVRRVNGYYEDGAPAWRMRK